MKEDFKGNINVDLIIDGGIIATMNNQYEIISKNIVLAIDASRIIFIGNREEAVLKYNATDYIDGNGKMLLPGLINSHTHTPMTLFRGVADDIKLKDWLYQYVFPLEAEYVNEKNVRLGAELALIEMVRTGTTCFNDMYYHTGIIAEVAENIGIRALLHEGLIDFPVPNAPTPDDGIRYTEEMLEKYKEHDLINFGVGVHSPYTCSGDLLQKARKLSEKRNTSLNIHLSESDWEVSLIKGRYGTTPTQYLEQIGFLYDNTIAAHCVKLTEEDKNILEQRKVGIAHNPQCNMKISSGAAPVPELISRGLKVGLGTDGVVSNNNLDMFDEMNSCALLHKFNQNEPRVMPAKSVFEMATKGSAKVLRMEKEIGSIEVGKKADIVIIDINKPHLTPLYNLYSQVAYSMSGHDVDTVIINGKIIMKNRKMLTIDEDRVIAEMNDFAREIKLENKYKKS